MGHVRVGDIRKLPLPVPPLIQQKIISETLIDIDDELSRASAVGSGVRIVRDTLADSLLTGRIRVPA